MSPEAPDLMTFFQSSHMRKTSENFPQKGSMKYPITVPLSEKQGKSEKLSAKRDLKRYDD
jgi:hypothetical protein